MILSFLQLRQNLDKKDKKKKKKKDKKERKGERSRKDKKHKRKTSDSDEKDIKEDIKKYRYATSNRRPLGFDCSSSFRFSFLNKTRLFKPVQLNFIYMLELKFGVLYRNPEHDWKRRGTDTGIHQMCLYISHSSLLWFCRSIHCLSVQDNIPKYSLKHCTGTEHVELWISDFQIFPLF